ncbi:transcriptional regulator with XRE-family HTH domain [Arcanobacterium wilhelmae]|uniref:Transcriptional regulator with XRE-family HTH domain n=1 Tax=Arcanobacterium wilhelmae TaxID=1803177 RepID=A0ABT9NBP0_9ACTO|nr:helix-turn-helix transcriptional regulator [Arcanobacterium wilhelmae]MDP9801127.1 transcriptional regulator with XRE-family HTH domain [Arcanobacterium wilhelmae]WFN90480.1 helix-turn-helix transcriptional regulator [Arcanobacterium wilhelmae]
MSGYNIDRELIELGTNIRNWRMILGVTAQQLSERGNISRSTLRKIENGDPGVSFNSVAQALRGLGLLRTVVDSTDPLTTDIGRLRADRLNRKRA